MEKVFGEGVEAELVAVDAGFSLPLFVGGHRQAGLAGAIAGVERHEILIVQIIAQTGHEPAQRLVVVNFRLDAHP